MTDELNALAGEVAAVDLATQPQELPSPEAAQPEPEAASVPLMTPEQEAEKFIDLVAWAVEKIWPCLGYKPETKKEAAQKLAPLLVKYNVVDTFFAKWGAEVEAGMFFAGVGYASYLAVKNAPAEPVEKKPWHKKIFAHE